MSERFTRLYTAPTDLYAENSPVLISAGALLKDNISGAMIAQLKFKNILGKRIIALKVLVHPMDIMGQPLGESIEKTYLDLSISRDMEFGQKEAIFLSDSLTRSFSAEVVSVIFDDKISWQSEGANWEQLPVPTPIAVNLQDNQLIKQWKINFGKTAEYVPGHYKKLWQCTCGQWNVSGVDLRCRSCFAEYSKLFSCDYEGLRLAKEKRVQRETEIRKQKKAEEIAYFKRAKRFTVALIIFLLLVAAGFAFYFLYPFKSQSDLEEGESFSDDIIQTNSSTSDKVEEIASLPVAVSKDDIGVGDLLSFGMYEQDNNKDNGNEPIEWLVLDRNDNSVMLLSKYALASKQFHEKHEISNWQNCDLRIWLNNYFYSVAFSTAEQNAVLNTVVDNSASQNNPIWCHYICDNTVDKVYLLSYQEVMSYFNTDESRQCGTTASIRPESNASIMQDEQHCFWWLRSPGKSTNDEAFVNLLGSVYYGNTLRDVCVRPVIWVDLSKAEFYKHIKAADREDSIGAESGKSSKIEVSIPSIPPLPSSTQKTSSSYGSSSSTTYRTEERKRDAWVCAIKYVEDNLKSPSTAKFCKYTDATVMRVGEDEYVIHGYVDAQNSFGATVRQDWTVSLFLTEKGFRDPYLEWG